MMRKLLAWVCAVCLIFGNVSLPTVAWADAPEGITQEAGGSTENEPVAIKVGGSRTVSLDTCLRLSVSQDQEIIVSADAPVSMTVQGSSSRTSYSPENGKLKAQMSLKAGKYELTFSGDPGIGSFTVRIEEVIPAAPEEEEPRETDSAETGEAGDESAEQKEEPAEEQGPDAVDEETAGNDEKADDEGKTGEEDKGDSDEIPDEPVAADEEGEKEQNESAGNQDDEKENPVKPAEGNQDMLK